MNVLLPSEIARLVLGYLTKSKCTATRSKFLEESPHLREYAFYLDNGHEYPTNISGHDLVHYLNIGYQYTQYITCGDPLKYPLPSLTPFYGFTNRTFPTAGSTGQESPAQQGTRTGTPMTSPRAAAACRTPRSGWPGASPAADRRSPADSLIDVTTVTEPPSSEPQFPPPKRLSEAGIQTDEFLVPETPPQPVEVAPVQAIMPTNQQVAQLPICAPGCSTQSSEPSVPVGTVTATSGNGEVLEISTGFPPCASPKRKPSAPKKRANQVDIFLSPPSFDQLTAKRALDDIVQTQLAARIAETINEAASTSKPINTINEDSMPHCGANLPDSVLSDVISKTLSDPLMEELAQYVASQSNSMDLETPTGTPLKGMPLKTPFKQIAEDVARHTPDLTVSEPAEKLAAIFEEPPRREAIGQPLPTTGFSAHSIRIQESMKIVVNSATPTGNNSFRPPMRSLPAPRKPSPKISPPESTSSTLIGERSQPGSDERTVNAVDFSSTVNINQIQPLPGTHIRVLDFGGTSESSNSNRAPPGDPSKQVPVKHRKRKAISSSNASPAKSRRQSGRGKNMTKLLEKDATLAALNPTVPVILSIPDSPAKSTEPAEKTTIGQRKTIMVEPVPQSRRTAPKRPSASRPKPRNRISGITPKQTASNSEFVMPTTPVKTSETVKRNRSQPTQPSRNSSTAPSKQPPATSAARKEDSQNLVKPLTSSNKTEAFTFDISAILDRVHRPDSSANTLNKS